MTLTIPAQMPGKALTATERYLKMLVFGEPGSGKTRLLESFLRDPRIKRGVVLDPTAGTTGVIDSILANGGEVRTCTDSESVIAMCAWLVKNGPAQDFNYLALDDFAEVFNQTCGAVAVKEDGAGAEVRWEHYNKIYERCRRMYRALRQVASPVSTGGAGCHVVVTVWADEKKDAAQTEWVVPALAKTMAFETPGYFDTVGILKSNMKREGVGDKASFTFQNILICQPEGQIKAKDRFDKIGRMPMPTGTKILDAFGIN